MTDKAIIDLVHQLNISPQAFQGVCEIFSQPDYFSSKSIDPHLRAIVAAYHTTTWFSTQGIPEIVAQHKGARPGDIFADLIFNVLVADVLDALKEIFCQEELSPVIN